jgi:regulation of enolase protein 1 (concanavalin A-like superfamily)
MMTAKSRSGIWTILIALACITFSARPASGGAPVSDDFTGSTLNTGLWSFVNPLNDGSFSMTGTAVRLNVPAGVAHDVWTGGNNSVRIMQAVSNADFEVEVKFNSTVSKRYQMQGLIAEQDSGKFVRCDFFSDGSRLHLFAASFAGGSPTVRANQTFSSRNGPLWMRLKRAGNTWTQSWSSDGKNFSTVVSFSYALTLARIGPFAGNSNEVASASPAFTAEVDYFNNTAAPPPPPPPSLTSVSPNSAQQGQSLGVTITGQNTHFQQGTSQVGFGAGITVSSVTVASATSLTAQIAVDLAAATGGRDVTVTTASEIVTLTGGFTVTAAATPPPVISNVASTASATSATITWTTDRPSTSQVRYGLTSAYGNTTPMDSTLVTSHSVTLSGLNCNTLYHYSVTSSDAGGANAASSGDFTFTTSAGGCGAPISDDFFSNTLNTGLWTFVNPRNDGSLSMTGTAVRLNVPAGVAHDVWTGANNSVRIMQTVSNADFEVEVKFNSTVSQRYQMQGLIAEQDSGNYVRCDFFSDGSALHLFAASFAAGSPTVRANQTFSSRSGPLWLRLKRAGNTWTQSWSTDGTNFSTVVSFSYPLTLARIGPFAGNSNEVASASPAFTAEVDYFFNTASPIIPEDGGLIAISNVAASPTATTATITWTTDRASTSQVRYGATSSYGSATPLDSSLVTSHSVILSNLVCGSLYHYSVTSTDAGGANPSSSSDATFTTAGCPSAGGPVSDNFDSTVLNTSLWTFVNPVGDATVQVNGSSAVLTLPPGNSHDIWSGGNMSARLVQPVANTDFEVELKFASKVTQQFQIQGLLVEQDANNYLRFDIYHGDNQDGLFMASFAGGTPTIRMNNRVSNGANFYIRLKRQGNTFAYSYSYDRMRWTPALTLTYTLNVTKVGFYAGNAGPNGGPAPGFTAVVDYFANRAFPPATDAGQPFTPAPAAPSIDSWNSDIQSFGQNGIPQQWVNILGNVADFDGIASLTYSLNNGPEQPLWLGENQVRLVSPGDFNVEIDYASLNPGANTVRITATDALGTQSTRTITVNYTAGVSWPRNYSIAWTPATNIQNVAQITDGTWQVQADGAVRTTQTGYDRLLTLGDRNTWQDLEVTAEVTIHSLDPYDFGVGIVAGWQGHTTNQYGVPLPDQPRTGHPFPGLGWYSKEPWTGPRLNIYCNTDSRPETVLIQDTSGRTLKLEVKYIFKLRVQKNAAGGSHYSFKVWEAASPEPSAWDLEVDGELGKGSIVLAAHRADVSFGAVSVTGL